VRGDHSGAERKPIPNRLHEGVVPFGRKHLQRRIPSHSGQSDRDRQHHDGDHHVLPGIERPLAAPCPVDGIRERQQVGDGPLVAIRSARADSVTEEVQMEGHRGEQRCLPFRVREQRGYRHDDEGSGDIVAGHVVIVCPPEERRGSVPREHLRHDPQTIEIGDDSGEGDDRPIPLRGVRQEIGHSPAHEEMCDRAQCAVGLEIRVSKLTTMSGELSQSRSQIVDIHVYCVAGVVCVW
jgi:hypothetical protein